MENMSIEEKTKQDIAKLRLPSGELISFGEKREDPLKQMRLEERAFLKAYKPGSGNSLKPREPKGTDNRHFEIEELSAFHSEIIRRIALGMNNTEVAQSLGCSQATVIYVKYSRAGRQHLKLLGIERDKMTVALKQRVSDLGPLAADVIEEAMMDENSSTAQRARVALKVLEMNGLSTAPPQEKDSSITDSVIESIKTAALNSGMMIFAPSEVEDAEVEEIVSEDIKDK